MAAPSTPNNIYLNQADGRVAIQWDINAGATSYTVQRSIDGVAYNTVGNPTLNQFLDTTVTLGVLYYYRVASTNASGDSQFSVPISCVPTMGGEMSLGQIQTAARQRADRLNSQFVTTAEVNDYINQSMYELYDLLIGVYEDYFKAPNAIFTSAGNQQIYNLPDGITSFKNDAGGTFVPAPIYKLLGVDLGLNTNANGWVTIDKYNFQDRNKYFYPNTASTIYGVFNCQYRWMGNNLELIPPPSNNQPFRVLYIPRLKALLQPQDVSTTSISGWLEYVITDVAIKILQKEESPIDVLALQKQALIMRIQAMASNRDAGRADTIVDVRGAGGYGGSNFPGGGF